MSEGEENETPWTPEEARRSEEEVRRALMKESPHYYEGRPMTFFMYPALTWKELEKFLQANRASQACLDKAILDLEKYHLSRL